jgi:PAS domain S-box-containing protein
MVAKGDALAQILDSLCRLVEEQASDVMTSILLVEGNCLRHGGAPSLPKDYTDAIDGVAIGPSVGSCGTAAFRGEQVIVENIATDPLWAEYRELALPRSLRACWSTPVFSSEGKVIATFAMYYREPRSPSPRDQEIIEQITHLAGVAIERKQTQEALQRSEAYLAESQTLTHTGSWVWDVATKEALYLSEEWYRIYGLDPAGNGRAWDQRLQRIHPEDRNKWEAALNRAISEKSHYEIEYRLLLPDGVIKYLHVVGHPIVNQLGDVVRFMGSVTDISERKLTQDALRRSEAYLTEAQRLSKIGSWAFSPFTRKAHYWSEEMFRIWGFDPQQGPPDLQTTLQRIHPEDFERMREFSEHAFDGHLTVDMVEDHRIVLPDGTVKYIHGISHPVFDEAGSVVEYIGTAVDITERKVAEGERERLHQMEADLAHTNRVSMMGELAASLAHEVKQPITAAATNARTGLRWLQRDPPDVGEARETISRIVKDVTRAADIIDRNRSMYRRNRPQRETVNFNELIREMIALSQDAASRQAISIRAEIDETLPPITADRVQMQQVLMNLMLNGIEAMKDEGGELTIGLKKTNDGQVQLSVRDSGIGLPVENAERIFDAFFSTKAQGTGMGLSISRRIVESHGGRLWATSNPDRGATFHFTVPAEIKALETTLGRTGS